MNKMLAAVLHDFNDLRLEEVPCSRRDRIWRCGCQHQVMRHLRHRLQGHQGHPPQRDFPIHPGPRAQRRRGRGRPGCHALQAGRRGHRQPSGYCGYCENCRVGQHPLLRARLHHRRRRPGDTSGRAPSRSTCGRRTPACFTSRPASLSMRPRSPSRSPARGRASSSTAR